MKTKNIVAKTVIILIIISFALSGVLLFAN